MVKSGFKSSEFYVALLGIGGIVWQQVQARCNFDMTFILSVGAVVVTYVLGRSWVKANQLKQPDL